MRISPFREGGWGVGRGGGEVPQETSPHLIQRAQDQRQCAEPGQEPGGSPRTSPGNRQATEAGVVWPRHEARHPLKSHQARHRRGRTQTQETTTEPVRRQGLDGNDLPRPPVDGRQQNSLEEDVCFFRPHVPPTTAKVEGPSE